MGFHFISFHSYLSIYFPFAYSAFALSAAQPAKSVGEIIEDGLGRQGESWSGSPSLAVWEMAPSPRRAVFNSSLGPGFDDARTQSSPYRSTPFFGAGTLWPMFFIILFGFGNSQSITIAAHCVKRRKLSNCLIYSFSHQCYESDRMYEQRGFTPPSLPLPYTRGSLILNWHAIYSPCSGSLFSLRDKNLFCFLPLGGRESCDLRPRALEPDSDTPHGLPLWASTHNAKREVHACMARGGRDTMDRQDAAGKVDVVWRFRLRSGGVFG
ncbi:hypothetical protein GGI35DRAFT_73260 [Trichoderma velutinum]